MTAPKIDVVSTNDILKTCEETTIKSLPDTLKAKNSTICFSVVDNNNNLIFTNNDFSLNQYDVIYNGGSVLSFNSGKLYIYSDSQKSFDSYKKTQLLYLTFIFICLFAFSLILVLYCYKKILKPFAKMKKLAKNIANGNFDIPLNMDKGNIFGAFTESFDLLRSELSKAKENERKAENDKKQLVASLSHDIKTPLSSIKAITELLQVTIENEKQIEKLKIIDTKADQIKLLTDNLFHATLEELNELKIEPELFESIELANIIRTSDYFNKVGPFKIDGVLIYFDKDRTAQVFDNIIGNSYKYAGTDIDIISEVSDGFLKLKISDYGNNAPIKNTELLTQKFYRGENSKGISGSGIGLFMCDYIMNKMDGHFEIESNKVGFNVILYFKMA